MQTNQSHSNTMKQKMTHQAQQVIKKNQSDHALSSNSESSDDEVESVQVKQNITVQRQSVSAEAYGKFNKKENFKPKIIPKNEDQKLRIKQRLSQAFMFSVLDDKEREIIVYAMEEKKYKQGDWVIKQGEQGDVLFVVDQGELDCYKRYTNETEDKYLKTYLPGESFGELALLFQAPRAASIKVKSDNAVLWMLDRETFSLIVKEASIKKREKYESFLNQWELLKNMDDGYERMKMSDAIGNKQFKKGDIIGQAGKKIDFYIIDEGQVGAFQNKGQIFQFDKQGEYFGVISCVLNKPEPFDYVALTDTKLFLINRVSYSSSLCIMKAKLEQHIDQKYKQYLK